MTIAPFAAGSAAADLNTRRLVAMKASLGTLSNQLSTGRTAETYGGLGSGRTQSLAARAQIGALDGYIAAAGTGANRVALATASVQQVATLGSTAYSGLVGAQASSGAAGRPLLQQSAAGQLGGVLDALNQSDGRQYILGGRVTDRPPVETESRLLDGDSEAGLDGVKAVIAERQSADLGAGTTKTGRLDLSAAGAAVSLSESASAGVRENFGFTLGRVVSSNPGGLSVALTAAQPSTATLSFTSQPRDGDIVRVTVRNADGSQGFVDLTARTAGAVGDDTFAIGADAATSAQNLTAALAGKSFDGKSFTGKAVVGAQSANPPGAAVALSGGTPASASVTVGTGLAAGDSLQVTVGLRDGTSKTLSLTAGDGTKAGSFAIGATPAATAANLSAALATALDSTARTDLAASSAVRAANDFFAGSSSPGLNPRRVATDADGNATGFVADPSGRTVIWYKGDDTSADPRRTATVPVSRDQSVGIGVQANEAAFRATLSGLAVLATTSFGGTETDTPRFDAYSARVQAQLRPGDGQPSVQGIASELSLASVQIATQKTQNTATKSMLEKTVDGVETVSTEETAAKLLSLQNQLQASYQATSMLSKLSLTNYL
ncbi:hypothetical protein [Methylobacterium indicum]|uniref:Flagellar protein n=1 Tax=Methylobacterium indicum TaxID=1775910 RepID=A0A8H8WRZ2_9HYPH|nr:hypothetical protein [Methylobacterium indicum]BCM83305.1 flagellar protein [Methylobacterium indicum]